MKAAFAVRIAVGWGGRLAVRCRMAVGMIGYIVVVCKDPREGLWD